MSGIEKLAQEYAAREYPDEAESYWINARANFEAGFRMAREMAAQDTESWPDIELRCMNDCCLKIAEGIRTVGERSTHPSQA